MYIYIWLYMNIICFLKNVVFLKKCGNQRQLINVYLRSVRVATPSENIHFRPVGQATQQQFDHLGQRPKSQRLADPNVTGLRRQGSQGLAAWVWCMCKHDVKEHDGKWCKMMEDSDDGTYTMAIFSQSFLSCFMMFHVYLFISITLKPQSHDGMTFHIW